MDFGNRLYKLKNKDEWDIYSENVKVATLKRENTLHYLYLDDRCIFSIEELEEILDKCKKKIEKK